MCSHSAPPLIMRLHSAVSWPKSDASTDGEMIARGIVGSEVVEQVTGYLPAVPVPRHSGCNGVNHLTSPSGYPSRQSTHMQFITDVRRDSRSLRTYSRGGDAGERSRVRSTGRHDNMQETAKLGERQLRTSGPEGSGSRAKTVA